MLILLLFLSLFQPAHSSCPEGFDLIRDGECRGEHGTVYACHDESIKLAMDQCKEIQGQPLSIHSEEDQTYWSSRASDWIIMGLLCNSITQKWQWMDGSAVDYKPRTPSDDKNYANTLNNDCTNGWTWYLNSTGYWSGGHSTAMMDSHLYCTVQLHPPVPAEDGCVGFDDDREDGECYQVGEAAETWQEAQMNCKLLGANLASIHNQQENSFVRRLAASKGALNGVFLGATTSGKGTDYGWVDGSTWDYENFHQGFPMAGFGDCVAMDTSLSAGQWMNMDCSSNLPVSCIRDQKPVVIPTCSAGPWEEGTIITSPGFPYSASTFCDYFLAVEVGKKVEVEIIFLEANSCCDSLLLYDGYLGAPVLANLTGEQRNVTYITTSSNMMRVNWQPNGGVNVRGMAMTFRGV
ncbi:hypothetical protein PENTCL1PPCAC_21553 [Pristionchus entomophagus]|uniref:CUB domain-containing protein n=1 Tax=Pristionchus entomophagus TaxID=358040 RepID=A0AAV5TZ70_9BILA|nr:hypothetical protein PENTCL1PPCAC_21552 [Pristionchus entomophagus]GMS99378.1 hypothetical protein PENTCL1PPCAC_21553 [Pristionchus entomophagus]